MDYSFDYFPVRESALGSLSNTNVARQHQAAYHSSETVFSAQPHQAPRKHTTDPYVTGTSVVGIVYKDGVMLAADTLASYGSLARFRDIQRLNAIGTRTLVGFSGELSDWDHINEELESMVNRDNCIDDGVSLGPVEIHSYLSRVLYGRRNKFDPLWNQLLVAGFDHKDKPYLGFVDLQGTTFTDNTLATGYGAYLALPLMRKEFRPDLTEAEAKKVLETALRVLWYRDARAWDKIRIAKITKADGVVISEPYKLETNWDIGYNARE